MPFRNKADLDAAGRSAWFLVNAHRLTSLDDAAHRKILLVLFIRPILYGCGVSCKQQFYLTDMFLLYTCTFVLDTYIHSIPIWPKSI